MWLRRILAILPNIPLFAGFVWSEAALPSPHDLAVLLFLVWFPYILASFFFIVATFDGDSPDWVYTKRIRAQRHIRRMEHELVQGGHIMPRSEYETKLAPGGRYNSFDFDVAEYYRRKDGED